MEPVEASEEAVSGACCRYADGAHLHEDCEMIRHMVDLMRSGIHVAIVTAAGVGGMVSHEHLLAQHSAH